jgi:hypothetical protein
MACPPTPSRNRILCAALTACVIWCGCSEESVELFVDVRTDLLPAIEFHAVRTEVFDRFPQTEDEALDARRRVVTAERGDPFIDGVRAAELGQLEKGVYHVRVRLLDRAGVPILQRIATVTLRTTSVVTITLSRDCRDVVCPAEDPVATECSGGICVDPRCTEETPELCPPPACESAADCPAPMASCVDPRCEAGVCLELSQDTRCMPGSFCDPDLGCFPGPRPCIPACSATTWRDAEPETVGNNFARGAMTACARPDGAEARFRRFDVDGALVADRVLAIDSADAGSLDDIVQLVCLPEGGAVFTFRDATSVASLVALDDSGNTLHGPLPVSDDATASSAPMGMDRLGSELYVFFVQRSGDGGAQAFGRRFDQTLTPLGPSVLVAPTGAQQLGADVVARESDVGVIFSDGSRVLFGSLAGDLPGLVVDLGPSSPFMALAWANGSTAACWTAPDDMGTQTICAVMDDDLGVLDMDVLARSGASDGPSFGLVADGCAFHAVTYCRSLISSCSSGGSHHRRATTDAAWTATSLPARAEHEDTVIGWLPQSAETLLHGSDLWHFGLSRSNGGGTTQLHDLRFACEGP